MVRSAFYLDKWYLDFVGPEGEAMIFYASKLIYHKVTVNYKCWINCNTKGEVSSKSHFDHVDLPEGTDSLIGWQDDSFGLRGEWRREAQPLQARLFEDEKGSLDWNCLQPRSAVELQIGNTHLKGMGYVEQLILTTPPWRIPMHHLRWGRFHAPEETIVWIELRHENKKQWLWRNGDRYHNCNITDKVIESHDGTFSVDFEKQAIIESEKKIYNVVGNLIKWIPGFKYLMPTNFLMAHNYKWLSKGRMQIPGQSEKRGMAIHEWVNFKD